jgi:uncharacterized repeat protein (TIGR01451 family)
MHALISAYLFAQVKRLRSNNRQASADDRGEGRKPLAFAAFGSLCVFDRFRKKSGAMSLVMAVVMALAMVLMMPVLAVAATDPGVVISNSAQLSLTRSGMGVTDIISSNTVTATVVPVPSASSLTVLRFTDATTATQTTTAGPTQCLQNGSFSNLPQPTFANGSTVDAGQVLALVNTDTVHANDAVFLQVTDADQNRNATVIDNTDLIVTSVVGDTETIRLRETGINTGVFVGYIQTRSSTTANSGDCLLQVDRDSQITATYTDSFNNTDTSNVSVLVDPYGLIFDSLTGQPVNGARVRLISAATGLPASVFGDNGISAYPSEMTTGNPVTDSGGTVYNLPAGVFRFPLVAFGQYRIEITPPNGYTFASGRSIAELNQLPGAPYRLSTASFGAPFSVSTPAAVAIDLPLDPSGTQLFVTKSTTTVTAAQGDFVQYQVGIQNASNSIPVSDVQVTDVLPQGLRYQAGSARLDGNVVADPAISSDGRTLNFAIGTLAAAANLKLSYVVEVTVAARDEKLVNRAQAANIAGASSNTAQATIRLRNELFNETSFIMGRVVTGTCEQNSETLTGVAGVRIYLEDGRYAVTDEEGKYHFEGVPAGSHVVQLDTVTVPGTMEPLLCDQRVRHAGRSYSQFVDVRAGALWRADFVLKEKAPPVGNVNYGMTTRIAGDTELLHTLNTEVSALPISNVKWMVTLPEGIDYVSGSATIAEQAIADPQNVDGTLIFRGNELAPDVQYSLSFKTKLKDAAAGGFIIKSVLLFDTPAQKNQRSETVENRATRGDMNYESASYRFSPHFEVLGTALSTADREQLDKLASEWRGVQNLRISAVGHTDKNLIGKSNQHLFADNYQLSKARAASVAEYLRNKLGLMPEQIETDGKGPDQPIAIGNDAASLAKNRRVEISIDGVRVKELGLVSVIKSRDAAPLVNTVGALVSKQSLNAASHVKANESVRILATDIDVETLSGGIAMVKPAVDEAPPIPSIKIAVQHLPTQKVELSLNGAPVSGLNFDGMSSKRDNSLALSRWRGVDLKEGDNKLIAIVRDADGTEVQRVERSVHYSGGAVRAELVKEQSSLTADGSTRPVIALRMFDAAGKPARPGTMGAYSVEAPYRSWWEVQQLQDKQLASLAPRDAQFTVDDDGLARIELEPTTSSGMAVIQLQFNERQVQDMRVWLAPQARDWVLVGLAEGSAGYNTISDNIETAAADDIEEGFEQDGRVAFFAKGRIKGDFLLTMAYDSARDSSRDKQSLSGVIDPDQYYSLYGDASQQQFEAASSRKVYIKLERRQFMAMFGDFNTGITITELSRYSRTLNGLKSEYAGEQFGYSAFAANTDQGYVQDELQGDGTSGLYQLTQRDIIAGTDKLRIEVRDRFNTGIVVSSTTLTRYIDYDIDYFNGSLYFKQPVMSRDADFNPQFIIVDYEIDSAMNQAVSAGGRAYAKLGKSGSEVGISFINEGAQVGDTRVAAIDTRLQLAEGTQLRAEVARSDSDNPANTEQANAYFTELKHVSKRIDANAFFRVEEDGFGFGQQLSTESGSRKAGVNARLKFNDKWSVRAEAQYQQLLTSDVERQLGSVQVQRDTQLTNVGVGVRHVADSNTGIGDTSSDQGFVSGSVKLLDQRLTLRAEQDVALSSQSEVTDYPDRSLLGIDYKLTRETSVFAEYEHASGAEIDTDMTRIGLRASPWQRAQLSSSMSQQFTENGARTFANLGLTQGWQINEKWAVDFGVDQSKTLRGADSYDFNQNTTLASGTYSQGTVTNFQTGDFLALSLASLYRSELWSLTERIEYRNSKDEDRWSLVSGFYREAVKGHAFALVAQYLNNDSNKAADNLTANLQLSWAYRPVDRRWIVLDKLDLKHQSTNGTSQKLKTSRLVNNAHANWQINTRTQVGLQLGARYVLSSFDGDEYSGTSGLIGADYRRDLNKIFDIGVHGSAMQSFNSGVSKVSFGADIGVTFMKNAWVSLGYNLRGYNDKDFDDAHYLSQGPYLKLRIKFDQDTFKDLNLSSMRAQK